MTKDCLIKIIVNFSAETDCIMIVDMLKVKKTAKIYLVLCNRLLCKNG